jgi:hypothetical protein
MNGSRVRRRHPGLARSQRAASTPLTVVSNAPGTRTRHPGGGCAETLDRNHRSANALSHRIRRTFDGLGSETGSAGNVNFAGKGGRLFAALNVTLPGVQAFFRRRPRLLRPPAGRRPCPLVYKSETGVARRGYKRCARLDPEQPDRANAHIQVRLVPLVSISNVVQITMCAAAIVGSDRIPEGPIGVQGKINFDHLNNGPSPKPRT